MLAGALAPLQGKLDALTVSAMAQECHVQVVGGAATGKSCLARELVSVLEGQGLVPLLVGPPPGFMDTAACALLQVGGQLCRGGANPDMIMALSDPRRPWPDKLSLLKASLREVASDVVMVADEPAAWEAMAGENPRAGARVRQVRELLLQELPLRSVVFSAVCDESFGQSVLRLTPGCAPTPWLLESSEWGALTPVAQALHERLGQMLADFSPLAVRLIVALASLGSVDDVVRRLITFSNRRQLARALADAIQGHPERDFLREAWRTLALVRRPFAAGLLEQLDLPVFDQLQHDILHRCLLHRVGGDNTCVLHPTLCDDVRSFKWLTPGVERKAHELLGRHYVAAFDGHVEDVCAEAALEAQMEACHHLALAGDLVVLDRALFYFVEQLDSLGRSLSCDHQQYASAARVYERAIVLDSEDDYAHHYLAYNLDVQGLEAPTVERHYRQALELDARNAWWHSRYVNFLITRGRSADARRAWSEALDSLERSRAVASALVCESLHVWVIRLLLHRGQLDFAAEVLADVPDALLRSHLGLRALSNRLQALRAARDAGAVFPLWISADEWWRGPHLASRLGDRGQALVRWNPGRVDAIDDGLVYLHLASPPAGPGDQPSYHQMVVAQSDFDRRSRDYRAASLSAGRFLELAYYDGALEEPVIRVYRVQPTDDADLPRLQPDPARYLRASGVVRR